MSLKMNRHYEWQAPELVVGSKEQRQFKLWIAEHYDYSTRNRLTSLKPEYLLEYLSEYTK